MDAVDVLLDTFLRVILLLIELSEDDIFPFQAFAGMISMQLYAICITFADRIHHRKVVHKSLHSGREAHLQAMLLISISGLNDGVEAGNGLIDLTYFLYFVIQVKFNDHRLNECAHRLLF